MASAPKILILNGPNLNLLGLREPHIYGHTTLSDIEASCRQHAEALGLVVDFQQSNSESTLIGWIHEARTSQDGIIINPAAYTHTSVAIMDALKGVALPTVEIHLSNTHQREDFRKVSYVSQVAFGVICGFGAQGYIMALDAMAKKLINEQEA
ncbi:type II 3-dehydroquinate dehydratase [Pelagibius sp. Alg239-R121]|uniref:type II 3-dehydroquinate dehydratase n=1 Tax=Pelagibius sp. Alg239-R121 TaxID=2993448 RepID=UPI0024A69A32|nr:type II 3-dehydroquinate dehydratase [Pelagibius sp. Alg239-R121]